MKNKTSQWVNLVVISIFGVAAFILACNKPFLGGAGILIVLFVAKIMNNNGKLPSIKDNSSDF